MADELESENISSILTTVIKKYEQYYLKENYSFDTLYKDILLPSLWKLTTETRYNNDLGDSNIESLKNLLANIKDKFAEYSRYTDLGNDEKARQELKEAIMVAGSIVKKMADINEILSEKGKSNENNINNNVKLESNSIAEDLILNEDDWDNLIDYIKEKKCVPFVGWDIQSSKNTLADLSKNWTQLFDYPFEDSGQISRVAQFIAIDKGNPMYPKRAISNILRTIGTPDYSKSQDSPYLTLSSLNLPIYITTNYDHALEEALRFHGKNPRSLVCIWSDDFKSFLEDADLASTLSSKYKPTSDEPLVYHLHGDMDIPQSLVLTERDYIQFIINLSREREKDIFPRSIRTALATSSLLFIGYSLEEINFRIIFQAVLGKQVGDMRETSISVQFPPRLDQKKQKKALKYLREYIKDQNVHFYWGNSDSFCKDLKERLAPKVRSSN